MRHEWNRYLNVLAGCALAGLLAACGSAPSHSQARSIDHMPENSEQAAVESPAMSTNEDSTSADEQSADVNLARTDEGAGEETGHGPPMGLLGADEEKEAASVADASTPEEKKASTGQDSGRPAWWKDRAVIEDGRILVSAEAVGRDVLATRRAAVAAGFDRLERAIRGDVLDERVVYTVVEPLPARTASRTGNRYIGFVLMSAVAPSDD